MAATGIPSMARVRVRSRDYQRCVRCNSRGDNWHHRRSRGVRDDHTHCPCNGINLCGSGTTGCHGWVHSHPFEARAMGWIVSRYAVPHETPVYAAQHGWVLLGCGGDTSPASDPREEPS